MRGMIKKFASAVAKKEVGYAWVSRYLQRKRVHVTAKWTIGMHSNRHKADGKANYEL
jgi:hypothetical protein